MFGSAFTFVSPWLLGLFVVLPALWWLLRMTPPAPRKVVFPALSLLYGLENPQQTPAHTPWWILLFRLLIAALLIFAFAGPVLNPEAVATVSGRLLIVIDNDWASARAWDVRQKSLHDWIRRAEHSNREVLLLPTAPDASGEPLHIIGPLAAKSAYGAAEAIKPEPWPAQWQQATQLLESSDHPAFSDAVWMSNGLGSIDTKFLYQALNHNAHVHVLNDRNMPVYLLAPPESEEEHIVLSVKRAVTDDADTVSVVALTADGHRLAEMPATFSVGSPSANATFTIPLDVRNQITRFEIERQNSAATTALLDGSWQKRPVGLVGDPGALAQRSLLDDLFYIDRALKPFADIHVDALDNLLKQKIAVIVMADTSTIPDNQKPALQSWIKKGGILIRFAGTHMASMAASVADDFLPVVLRNGDRALGGTLSWSTPQKLSAFSASSPFHGLPIPSDVTVSRQVLAEPSEDLAGRSWAMLADGTPLVTAKSSGQGIIVLFHVPARSDWSNVSLSGLFVDMLRRLVDLSHDTSANSGLMTLPPFQVLNGFGELQKPGSATMPFIVGDQEPLLVGPQHPPGLYGNEAYNVALNLGSALPQPEALNGITPDSYQQKTDEIELQPYLLVFVLGLLLGDFIISLMLRGLLPAKFLRKSTALLLVFCFLTGTIAHAATEDRAAVNLTADTYLAYIETGNQGIDHLSQQGLTGLAHVLEQRTSIDKIAVTGVNPNTDELAYYPFLYWPLQSGAAPLTAQGADHINDYLHRGGMILLDSMDGQPLSPRLVQHILSNIDLPPLEPLPQKHVLKHSFYLLDEFPGRYASPDFWLEPEDTSSYDGVATVLYGVNGWAAAWAVDERGQPLFACVPGGDLQREYAYRFGVNLVMYALTGNYKSDQLQAQALLKRLGK